MKKHLLTILAMLVVGISGAWAATAMTTMVGQMGPSDNSGTLWSYYTKDITMKDGEKYVYYFTNYNNGGNYYNNWILSAWDGTTNTNVRPDGGYWGGVTPSFSGKKSSDISDWMAQYNGATVVVTISYKNGTVTIVNNSTLSGGDNYTNTFTAKGFSGNLTFHFSNEYSHQIFSKVVYTAANGGVTTYEAKTLEGGSWTFTGLTADTDVTTSTTDTKTESRTTCYLATAPDNCKGLYFQGKWKEYKGTSGLRNVDGGARMVLVPDLKAGDLVTVTVDSTRFISNPKYVGTTTKEEKDNATVIYPVEADGNFYFSFNRINNNSYPQINSITVQRESSSYTEPAIDRTSLIKNPSFESATVVSTTIADWTQSTDALQTQNNTAFTGKDGTYYAERWHRAGSFDINQTISKENLPAGYYVLTARAQGSNAETTKLYANTTETGVSTNADYTVKLTLDGETYLKIGFKFTGTTSSWDAVDNFRLEYYTSEAAYNGYTAGTDLTDKVANASCGTGDWATNLHWSTTNVAAGTNFHTNWWSTEGNTDKSGFTTNENGTNPNGKNFIEAWNDASDASDAALADNTISHDAISDLTAGVYVITGQVRAYKEYSLAKTDVISGVKLYAGSNEVSAVNGSNCMYTWKTGTYGTYSVAVDLAAATDLAFGLKLASTNANWVAFKDFTLTYYGTIMDSNNAAWTNAQTAANNAITAAAKSYADYASLDAYTALTQAQVADATVANLNTLMEATMNFTQAVRIARQAAIEAAYAEAKNMTDLSSKLTWSGDMTATGSGQHWDGTTTTTYYDDNGESVNKTEKATITLPAGDYIYAAYGRGFAGSQTYISYGEQKFYMNNDGDTGFGVTTAGAPSVYGGDTYTNDNIGRGWDYGYIKFTLDKETEVTLSATYGSDNWCWVSLCTPMLYGTPATAEKISTDDLKGYKTFYDANNSYKVDNTKVRIYKAEAIESTEATTITMDYVTNTDVIPANTPVLLRSLESNTTPMVLTATLETAPEGAYEGNAFDAYDGEAEAAVEGAYVLGYLAGEGNGFGFYPYSAKLKIGQVYVQGPSKVVSVDAKKLSIIFNDAPTAINNVNAAKANAAAQGKFMKNGKLVIVKNGKQYNAAGAQVK